MRAREQRPGKPLESAQESPRLQPWGARQFNGRLERHVSSSSENVTPEGSDVSSVSRKKSGRRRKKKLSSYIGNNIIVIMFIVCFVGVALALGQYFSSDHSGQVMAPGTPYPVIEKPGSITLRA